LKAVYRKYSYYGVKRRYPALSIELHVARVHHTRAMSQMPTTSYSVLRVANTGLIQAAPPTMLFEPLWQSTCAMYTVPEVGYFALIMSSV